MKSSKSKIDNRVSRHPLGENLSLHPLEESGSSHRDNRDADVLRRHDRFATKGKSREVGSAPALMRKLSLEEFGTRSQPGTRDAPSITPDIRPAPRETETFSLDQIRPPEHLIKQHEHFAESYWTRLANERAGRILSPDEHKVDRIELDQKACEMMSHAALWMRVRGSLDSILDDGRFKSQFETGYSAGESGTAGRELCEEALFGYRADLSPEKRPLYGYVSEDPNGKLGQRGALNDYGGAAIRFKDTVKERTTVTMADSLECTDDGTALSIRAVPFNNPDRRMFRLMERETITGDMKQVKDPLTYRSVDEVSPYAEAQYHGGLRSTDIEEVVFTYRPSEVLAKKLDDHEIQYRVIGNQ